MTVVLAAIDGSPVSDLVLADAGAIVRLPETRCLAIHVRDPDGLQGARAAAERAGIPLQVVDGDPGEEFARALAAPGVVLGVVGIHDADGPRAHGTTASFLLAADRPLLVVPPGSRPLGPVLRRVLLPLDGAITTTRAAEGAIELLRHTGAQFVVLHTFTQGTIPSFWSDEPEVQTAWEQEFLARYFRAANGRLILRRGDPGRHVVDLAETAGADLVVLGWHQDLSDEHAAVVRAALQRSPVPVLLMPAERDDADSG